MDDNVDKVKTSIRAELDSLLGVHSGFNCTITSAVPTMQEVLPPGCSKALGVRKLCEALGIDMSTELLAIGDAENDVEMLQQAAIGICVGNGVEWAKQAADIVMDETDDEGAAGIAVELFGLGKILQQQNSQEL